MANKHERMLAELEELYTPYSDFFGSELTRIEGLIKEYEKSKDPVFASFREHPMTIKFFKHAAGIYRQSKMQLANDDGSLSKEDRIRLHVSSLWALAWIKFVGGDPVKMQQEIENEIERVATSAGIELHELSTQAGE